MVVGKNLESKLSKLNNLRKCDIIIQNTEEERMIRQSIKNIIYESLDYSIFRRDDFEITEDINDGEYVLNIKKDEFYFMIILYSDSDKYIICCSPGQVTDRCEFEKDIKFFVASITKDIREWLNRVKIELLEPVNVRYINASIESFIRDLDEKLQEVDDAYFTKEEGEQLAERLDKLEEMIKSREGVEKENEQLYSEINKIKTELEFLKATINNTTKRKWLKNMLLKINAWRKDPSNQELIQLGMEGVKTIAQNIPDMK